MAIRIFEVAIQGQTPVTIDLDYLDGKPKKPDVGDAILVVSTHKPSLSITEITGGHRQNPRLCSFHAFAQVKIPSAEQAAEKLQSADIHAEAISGYYLW